MHGRRACSGERGAVCHRCAAGKLSRPAGELLHRSALEPLGQPEWTASSLLQFAYKEAADGLQLPLGAPWFCHNLDCPKYDVLETTDDYEIRKYDSGGVRVVAHRGQLTSENTQPR